MGIRVIQPHSWHSVLVMLRNRHVMYLGSKSCVALMHFIDGMFMGAYFYKAAHMPKDFDWARFEEWFRTKFKVSKKRSFSYALEQAADSEAFDLWFSWYDDYIAADGKEDYEAWEKKNEEIQIKDEQEENNPELY
jgi:hypothetical protein